jgi:AmpE protein
MNFLALLTGIVMERWLTRLFHLREFRWLDRVFDFVYRLAGRSTAAGYVLLAATALLLVLPVAALQMYLTRGWLLVVYFGFAVLVLLFSLGPRDLASEVEDVLAALERGDQEALRRVTKEITELPDVRSDSAMASGGILERSIYLQANNRLFAVVFWFFALGPTGAWAFRVLDLMRRRAVFTSMGGRRAPVEICTTLHGIVAWIPARLLAAGFALAGNFQGAFAAWKSIETNGVPFAAATARLPGTIGVAARGETVGGESPASVSREALALIGRTLLVWCVVIALLTLNEWLI